MGKINGSFFRRAIRDKDLSMQTVAEHIGMKYHSQLSSMLSNKRRMQMHEAIALSQLLSIPLTDVIGNAGFPEVIKGGWAVPVIGALRNNGTVEEFTHHTERAAAPNDLPNNVVAIQARTSNTPISWIDRWVFFCGPEKQPSELEFGQFCLIQVENGPLAMGSLRRGYSDDSYAISGPFTADSVKVSWVKPVLMTRN